MKALKGDKLVYQNGTTWVFNGYEWQGNFDTRSEHHVFSDALPYKLILIPRFTKYYESILLRGRE